MAFLLDLEGGFLDEPRYTNEQRRFSTSPRSSMLEMEQFQRLTIVSVFVDFAG